MKFICAGRTMVSVLSVIFTYSAHASSSPILTEFHKIRPPKVKCEDIRNEFQKLLPQGGLFADTSGILPRENFDAAVRLLIRLPSFTNGNVRTEMQALKEDIESVLPQFLTLITYECNPMRLYVNRWIMNTLMGQTLPEESRKFAMDTLKASLLTPHQPTLLNVHVSIAIFMHGLDKKLWHLSDDDREALKKIDEVTTSEGVSISAQLEGAGNIETIAGSKKDEVAARLRSNLGFQKVKHVYFVEAETANKHLMQLIPFEQKL